jgi:transposase
LWEEDGVVRRGNSYPPELRERAVRMVAEVRPDYPSDWPAIKAVAAKLGIGSAETLRKWVRRAEVDGGARPGVSSEESAELRKLRAEVRELRRANEILKAASAFFALMPRSFLPGGARSFLRCPGLLAGGFSLMCGPAGSWTPGGGLCSLRLCRTSGGDGA